jgi:hypothetical protein
MAPAERAAVANRLSTECERLALIGIRSLHPNLSPAEERLHLLTRKYGQSVVDAAFGRAPTTNSLG